MKHPKMVWGTIGAGAVVVAVLVGVLAAQSDMFSDDDIADGEALQRLANVAKSDAEAAALKVVEKGTVKASKLEAEDGTAIWKVDVTAGDGTSREVTIDAGNGKLLEMDLED
jgi:uncharacterized membrane protein YkoI